MGKKPRRKDHAQMESRFDLHNVGSIKIFTHSQIMASTNKETKCGRGFVELARMTVTFLHYSINIIRKTGILVGKGKWAVTSPTLLH